MTYTFINREIDNCIAKDLKESRKEGKLEPLTSTIKEGILTLKQAADKMNLTIPQFETAIKNLPSE